MIPLMFHNNSNVTVTHRACMACGTKMRLTCKVLPIHFWPFVMDNRKGFVCISGRFSTATCGKARNNWYGKVWPRVEEGHYIYPAK